MPLVAPVEQGDGVGAGPGGGVRRHGHGPVQPDDERVGEQPERDQAGAAHHAVGRQEGEHAAGGADQGQGVHGPADDDARHLQRERRHGEPPAPQRQRTEPVQAAAGRPPDRESGQQRDDGEGHVDSVAAGRPDSPQAEEDSALVFDTVIVVDHGVTAVRVVRTCQRLGVQAIAVHGDEDGRSPHVRQADDAVPLGGRTTAETYGDARKLLEAAQRSGAQAVHPGAGSLAGDPGFARMVVDAGLTWLGPPPDLLGPAPAVDTDDRPAVVVTVLHDGRAPRCLGRRSRLGALVDEEPAPGLGPDGVRDVEQAATSRLAAAPPGAYAVEVHHGPDGAAVGAAVPLAAAGAAATAAVTGTDPLEVQLRAAAGERVQESSGRAAPVALSLAVRVPEQFGGRLRRFRLPSGDGVQAECGVGEGGRLSAHSARLLAVVTAAGPDRPTALARARTALDRFEVSGVPTNLPLLRAVLDDPSFVAGTPDDALRERTRRA